MLGFDGVKMYRMVDGLVLFMSPVCCSDPCCFSRVYGTVIIQAIDKGILRNPSTCLMVVLFHPNASGCWQAGRLSEHSLHETRGSRSAASNQVS